jgi:hypothetical protein
MPLAQEEITAISLDVIRQQLIPRFTRLSRRALGELTCPSRLRSAA